MLLFLYFYRPNLMRSISGSVDYKISFVMSVCLCPLLCPQISSDFDQTRYGGLEPEGKGRVRVWYKSDINFLFYTTILDLGLLQQKHSHSYIESLPVSLVANGIGYWMFHISSFKSFYIQISCKTI
jgi:hypothetical protein